MVDLTHLFGGAFTLPTPQRSDPPEAQFRDGIANCIPVGCLGSRHVAIEPARRMNSGQNAPEVARALNVRRIALASLGEIAPSSTM
jgi:hypothetical protein